MRPAHDEEMIAEAVQFADQLDCIAPDAGDSDTVRVAIATLREAARFIRSVVRDAEEQAAQARAAHDCVTAADRIIQRLEERNAT